MIGVRPLFSLVDDEELPLLRQEDRDGRANARAFPAMTLIVDFLPSVFMAQSGNTMVSVMNDSLAVRRVMA
jgi:hypothetical protein